MPRYLDFDAFRKEVAGEPVRVKVYGKTYTLRPQLPARVMVDILRLQVEQGDGEMPPTAVLTIADALLTRPVFEEILANDDFTVEDMGELIKHLMGAYTGGEAEDGPLDES